MRLQRGATLLRRTQSWRGDSMAATCRWVEQIHFSSTSASNNNRLPKQTPRDKVLPKNKEKDLKWTERKEAPKWLQKIAPTKGGTKLPTPLEGAVIACVVAAGYYSWFVEPPKQQQQDDR
mmetsp:Transcript_46919/g.69776  ORF Transcript_46919/g.69776 Transcript_46919/m.69776 type:complete len:120 (-) Transcript_46919:37-396(-)